MSDELAQDPNAHAGLRDETLGTLASSRFYMTYLMKLEGLPDSEWGESVAVALVAEAGMTEGAVLDFCRDQLARFKKPKHVFFLEELPKNAYGKVLRRTLRERFASPR